MRKCYTVICSPRLGEDFSRDTLAALRFHCCSWAVQFIRCYLVHDRFTMNCSWYLNFITSTGTVDRWFSSFPRFGLFGPSFSGPAFSAPPSKPDVEFQYGRRLGEFHGMSSQGAATWRIQRHVIPEPRITLHDIQQKVIYTLFRIWMQQYNTIQYNKHSKKTAGYSKDREH